MPTRHTRSELDSQEARGRTSHGVRRGGFACGNPCRSKVVRPRGANEGLKEKNEAGCCPTLKLTVKWQ